MKKLISKIRHNIGLLAGCSLLIPMMGLFIWWLQTAISVQNTSNELLNTYLASENQPIPTYPSIWDEVGNNPMCKCSASFNISFPDYDSLYLHGRYYYVTQYFIMDWADRIKSITHDQYDMANLPICETVDLP